MTQGLDLAAHPHLMRSVYAENDRPDLHGGDSEVGLACMMNRWLPANPFSTALNSLKVTSMSPV